MFLCRWLSFHSGYDFGYLLNLLTAQNLPKTESEFFECLKLYFPNVYDVKYLMKSCKNLKGGLQASRASTIGYYLTYIHSFVIYCHIQ